jgi:hypothetical protein
MWSAQTVHQPDGDQDARRGADQIGHVKPRHLLRTAAKQGRECDTAKEERCGQQHDRQHEPPEHGATRDHFAQAKVEDEDQRWSRQSGCRRHEQTRRQSPASFETPEQPQCQSAEPQAHDGERQDEKRKGVVELGREESRPDQLEAKEGGREQADDRHFSASESGVLHHPSLSDACPFGQVAQEPSRLLPFSSYVFDPPRLRGRVQPRCRSKLRFVAVLESGK